jgi:glycosyltransferase involved in cell wall biosynthesis
MEPGPLYVEVSALLHRHLTGIGRFAARLLEALLGQTPLRLVCTIDADSARRLNLSTAIVRGQEIAVQGPLPSADPDVAAWARALLHRPRHRLDLEFSRQCPALFTLLRPPARHFRQELGILYDLTPLIMPWAHVADTRTSFGRFFTQDARGFDKLVAISRATRGDARWLCDLPQDDIVVGYPGPSLCVRQHASGAAVPRDPRLILLVSTLEPRKNGRFVLDWFLRTSALPAQMELCWVGPKGWMWESTPHQSGGRSGRRVTFTGMISDRELCQLYRRAAFAIYPSLYEGFGFPVLDALWHGKPVLCAFNSSLQEFAGTGVYYFDPCDGASLDQACRELLVRGPAVPQRQELQQRFSWDRLARLIVALAHEQPLAA